MFEAMKNVLGDRAPRSLDEVGLNNFYFFFTSGRAISVTFVNTFSFVKGELNPKINLF